MKTTKVRHAFADQQIPSEIETLVIGTFNPGKPWIDDDFFYGSPRNHLWTIVPAAFGHSSLKGRSKEEKLSFCREKRFWFVDLIEEVEVEWGHEHNRSDNYLDKFCCKWRNLEPELEKLGTLKRACFTRKGFVGIPNIEKRVKELAAYLASRNIPFRPLVSPARYHSPAKQMAWDEFLLA